MSKCFWFDWRFWLQLKLDQGNRESASLQNRIDALEEEKARATKYIRELEQKNDDLERSQRCITETVAAFEASLNSALERNAMLESEVDEKEHLKDNLQRLVDETRGNVPNFCTWNANDLAPFSRHKY